MNICELGGFVFICRRQIAFYNPQMMHVSLIGDFKLAAGVDVSYCLSLCVSPIMGWGPVLPFSPVWCLQP